MYARLADDFPAEPTLNLITYLPRLGMYVLLGLT